MIDHEGDFAVRKNPFRIFPYRKRTNERLINNER